MKLLMATMMHINYTSCVSVAMDEHIHAATCLCVCFSFISHALLFVAIDAIMQIIPFLLHFYVLFFPSVLPGKVANNKMQIITIIKEEVNLWHTIEYCKCSDKINICDFCLVSLWVYSLFNLFRLLPEKCLIPKQYYLVIIYEQ